jgi:acetylornithine/N-succinyldiaminopimelate aminotransferase
LGGGFPVGAMLCREFLSTALPPGSHGSTYGGNPLATAAALAVLSILDEEKLIDGARTKGESLGRMLRDVCAKFPDLVGPERGVGLLRAVPLLGGVDPRSVLSVLRERGLLLIMAGDSALRLCPPLVVTEAELERGISILGDGLAQLRRQKGTELAGARA